MHWSNGRFHENIVVGKTIYITDHKHIAVFGGKDYTEYGESSIHSYIKGKNVGITASNKFFADSTAGSNLWSKEYIHIESGSNTANHERTNRDNGIEIVSKKGNIFINTEVNEINIHSNNNSINLEAGEYVNINSGNGITINNVSYGTSLPGSGVEGEIFFKLIS